MVKRARTGKVQGERPQLTHTYKYNPFKIWKVLPVVVLLPVYSCAPVKDEIRTRGRRAEEGAMCEDANEDSQTKKNQRTTTTTRNNRAKYGRIWHAHKICVNHRRDKNNWKLVTAFINFAQQQGLWTRLGYYNEYSSNVISFKRQSSHHTGLNNKPPMTHTERYVVTE